MGPRDGARRTAALHSNKGGLHQVGVAILESSKRTAGPVCRPLIFFLRDLRPNDLLLHQKDLVTIINFDQFHLNHFVYGGLNVASHEAGLDWELAMAAINEHTQLNLSRPALGKKSIHRGSRRTAGKQNIIYQNNVLVFD